MHPSRLSRLHGLTLLATMAAAPTVHSATGIDDANAVYSQNFNSLSASVGSHPWVNDSTLAGWGLFNSLGQAPATYRSENGNQDIGSFSSYGGNPQGAFSNERALGGIADGNAYFGSPAVGAAAGWIAVAFVNQTGATLDSLTLAYTGEQWRYAGAPAQSLTLEYGFGTSFASVAAWTAPGGTFDFQSPLYGGLGLGGVDGNAEGRVVGLGGTQQVQWQAGDTLWVRWSLLNSNGAKQGLAIDDLSLGVTAAPPVPEPGTLAMMLGGVAALGALARRSTLR